MSNIDKINSSRLIPPVQSKGNVDKNNVGSGESFEELLEKAMRNGPTNTDDIGMDPDTMKMIKSTTSVFPKESEEKQEPKYEPNDQVSAILATQSSIIRTIPKDPYKNKK